MILKVTTDRNCSVVKLQTSLEIFLSTALDLRPRAVLKTSNTVFSRTERPRPVNNLYIIQGLEGSRKTFTKNNFLNSRFPKNKMS